MRRTILTSFTVLSLLSLVLLMGLSLNIQTAKASGTIIIEEDGSLYPPTAPIQRNGSLYTFTDNILGRILFRRSNIVIDGNGYALYGDGSGNGFHTDWHLIADISNVTILNTNIKNFSCAINLVYTSFNTISGNILNSNRYSFGVWGNELKNFLHSIDASNRIEGKPAFYLVSQKNLTISPTTHGQIGYLALVDCDNVTIEGLTLEKSYEGLLLAYTKNSKIMNNTISDNINGILLYHSSNNTVSGNVITSNAQFPDEWGYGLGLRQSNHNTITSNTVMNNCYGIRLIDSSSNSMAFNNITNNNFNFGVSVWNTSLDYFIQDIDTSNIVQGKPIYYIVNQNNITIDSNTFPSIGYLGIVNSTNIVVKDLNISRVGEGVLFAWTANSTIERVQASNNHYGLALVCSKNNKVSQNMLESIYHTGIITFLSSNDSIVDNNILDSGGSGLRLYALNNSMISRNVISNSFVGIGLDNSFENLIDGNTVKNSSREGLFLSASSYNSLLHNNFMNNTYQSSLYNSVNEWDNGFEGNYWSDYNGTDLNNDGIGDTIHVIDENNIDHYPLMGMFSDFNATSEHQVQTICNSTISDFQFNGTAICFNVTGEDGTTGFCRTCIPRTLMNDTYEVFVNGTEVQCTLLPCSNSTQSYVYFTYTHSTQEVIIIPEFPSFPILSLFMISTLLAVIVYRRKHGISRES
jgi:parallel beta-helix repeat protein